MAVAKKKKANQAFDAPWKEMIEYYFAQFMLFFFPRIHAAIDWSCPPIFLDKELQQLVRRAKQGKQVVDKLVQVCLQEGQEVWLYIHIEIQSQYETAFSYRMFVYYFRIREKYGNHRDPQGCATAQGLEIHLASGITCTGIYARRYCAIECIY